MELVILSNIFFSSMEVELIILQLEKKMWLITGSELFVTIGSRHYR
jgi:hypothetical protein